MDICESQILIFCIQEHFTMINNLYKLSKAFPNFSVLSVPAIKDCNVQDRGRPKGGLSIILPKVLRKSIKLIKSDYWRIQPILLTIGKMKYLIINTYFPTDSKKPNDDCEELQTCRGHINSIINMNKFNHVWFVGDQNYEVSRNTNHVRMIKNMVEESNFYDLWSDYEVDFTYSFESENGHSVHTVLDHIFTLNRSKSTTTDA